MPAPILDDISHRRYNPLRGSWVLVSPHRTKRPWQGAQEETSKTILPEHDPSCYLCPGNKRAQGDQNPKYESTFVFVNDYSAVREEQEEYKGGEQNGSLSSRLLRAESVTGKCYVITFAPSHNLTLADLTPVQILPVIHTWTQIYTAHLSPNSLLAKVAPPTTLPPNGHDNHSIAIPNAQYRYMQIFENKGAAMGCSNPHPHGQVWTTTSMPEEPGLELEQLKKYRWEQGGVNLLEDYAKLESEMKERVIFENSAFLAVCPWWATWPFEVMVVARQHKRALVDFSDQDRTDLAEALAEVTRRYDNLFETRFPYSMGLHQAPLDGTDAEIEASHFHIHFYPPLLRSATVRKFLVGYEMMAEPQRDITPEQAAARLRDCGGELYRKKTNGTTEKTDETSEKTNGTTEKINETMEKTNGVTDSINGTTEKTNGTTEELNDGTTEKTNEGAPEKINEGTMEKTNEGAPESINGTTEKTNDVAEKTNDVAEKINEVTMEKTNDATEKINEGTTEKTNVSTEKTSEGTPEGINGTTEKINEGTTEKINETTEKTNGTAEKINETMDEGAAPHLPHEAEHTQGFVELQ